MLQESRPQPLVDLCGFKLGRVSNSDRSVPLALLRWDIPRLGDFMWLGCTEDSLVLSASQPHGEVGHSESTHPQMQKQKPVQQTDVSVPLGVSLVNECYDR